MDCLNSATPFLQFFDNPIPGGAILPDIKHATHLTRPILQWSASLALLVQTALGSPPPAPVEEILRFETPAQLHSYNVESFENIRNAFGLSRVIRIYANPLHQKMLIVGNSRVESISLVSNALSKSIELNTLKFPGTSKDGTALTMTHPAFVPSAPLDDKAKATFAGLSKEKPLVRDGGKVWGALFAKQQCIRCHKGYKPGEVIGAFVYELERPQPLPEKKPLEEARKKAIREVTLLE